MEYFHWHLLVSLKSLRFKWLIIEGDQWQE
jgi:hypothetical protein